MPLSYKWFRGVEENEKRLQWGEMKRKDNKRKHPSGRHKIEFGVAFKFNL